MNDRKSISDYKEQAKESLLGNYTMAVGSFVLIFALFYCLYSVIVNAVTGMVGAGAATTAIIYEMDYFKSQLVQEGVGLIVGAFYTLLLVGYFYIIRKISRDERANVSDVFYAFKNHPDKVLIMYFILAVVKILVFIPADYVNYKYVSFENLNGQMFFAWIVLLVLGMAMYVYVSLAFSMSFFVYLYEGELSAMQCLTKSYKLMQGHKLRYLYMVLSFIGYWVLSVLSMGIGCLYTMAYQSAAKLNMYKDIAEITEAEDSNQGWQNYEKAFYE